MGLERPRKVPQFLVCSVTHLLAQGALVSTPLGWGLLVSELEDSDALLISLEIHYILNNELM